MRLDVDYAPFIIGDEICDRIGDELPSLLSVSWCALYPLAIYFMTALSEGIPDEKELQRPQGPSWTAWNPILEEYWRRRDWQTHTFRAFLEDWGLDEILGMPRHNTKNESGDNYESPYVEDRKVLGLHRFRTWKEVSEYALRWARNPLIRDTHLWQHRITVSRGIDLICSELLANGFEHGGSGSEKEVFIMAKLCSKQSAWRALEIDKITPCLTDIEKRFFSEAVHNDCPLLQLCIGDTGQGFGGNEALRSNYVNATHLQHKDVDEAKLIEFALSGKISTKKREHHRSYWKEQLSGNTELTPTTHGLAEVRRFVRKMRGYWRIHSNGVAIDQDYFQKSNLGAIPVSDMARRQVRKTSGCLHYFIFPLLAEQALPTIRHVKNSSKEQHFRLIDVADDALVNDPLQVRIGKPDEWVGSFCSRILKAGDEHSGVVLLHLETLDQLEKNDLEDVCLDLIHCLHRVRDDLAIFISGASEETRFQISRYWASATFDLKYRVLPFLRFQSVPNDGIELQLGCSDEVALVQDDLTRVLLGRVFKIKK